MISEQYTIFPNTDARLRSESYALNFMLMFVIFCSVVSLFGIDFQKILGPGKDLFALIGSITILVLGINFGDLSLTIFRVSLGVSSSLVTHICVTISLLLGAVVLYSKFRSDNGFTGHP